MLILGSELGVVERSPAGMPRAGLAQLVSSQELFSRSPRPSEPVDPWEIQIGKESSHQEQGRLSMPGENGETPGAGPDEKDVLVKKARSWAVSRVSLVV